MAKTMQPLVIEGETRQVPVYIHEPCLTGVEWDEALQGPIRDVECSDLACELRQDEGAGAGEWLKVWVER